MTTSAAADWCPDDWCHAWCSCPDSHWRVDDGRDVWRTGVEGCTHPRHDGTCFGLSVVDVDDPVAWQVSLGHGWCWAVVRDGVLARYGWADWPRHALPVVEREVVGEVAVRCDLVAAEAWRFLVDRERRRNAA